jgi:hypothetical protein
LLARVYPALAIMVRHGYLCGIDGPAGARCRYCRRGGSWRLEAALRKTNAHEAFERGCKLLK